MKISNRKTVYGMGVNDADYVVSKSQTLEGKRTRIWCPYFLVWRNMLYRCYGSNSLPTYKDCTVCPPWHIFSKFKSWMQLQSWEGNELDKDLLIPGNKLYSPSSCVFISRALNNLLTDQEAPRGSCVKGVYFTPRQKNPYRATVWFEGKSRSLGSFASQELAGQAYIKGKAEIILKALKNVSDPRISLALRSRLTLMSKEVFL